MNLPQLLVIERPSVVSQDDRGHDVETYANLATVRGLVDPKTAAEVAQLNQAGAVLADYTIYTLPTDVAASDRIRLVPDDGRRFEIRAVRRFQFGTGIDHLEIDAQQVTP